MTDPVTPPPDPMPPVEPSAPPPPVEPMPAAPAPVPAASGAGRPADVGPRFLARLIDHILLGIVTSVIIVPLLIASAFSGVGTGSSFGFGFDFGVGSLIASIVTAVITIGYFALMESNMGQTVGKMALSLRTEGPGGGKPTLEQALKRNAWYALAIIPFLGGLAQLAIIIYIAVTISQSAAKVGWHDTFAGGTRVVTTK
ncbi:MAG TPA: RDD family protein [Acidimicrobiia bacterium]